MRFIFTLFWFKSNFGFMSCLVSILLEYFSLSFTNTLWKRLWIQENQIVSYISVAKQTNDLDFLAEEARFMFNEYCVS